jgi:hypothetical protein
MSDDVEEDNQPTSYTELYMKKHIVDMNDKDKEEKPVFSASPGDDNNMSFTAPENISKKVKTPPPKTNSKNKESVNKSSETTAEVKLRKLTEALQLKASQVKEKPKHSFFTLLVGFCAFAVAGCAAFFSVRGIALLFAEAALGVLIMASALEVSKLVTASFLYRYWLKITILMKFYLVSAVILLIGITSLGIFGYLSDAFETTKNKVSNYESQIEKLETDITFALGKINTIREADTDVNIRADKAVDDYKVLYDSYVIRKQSEKKVLTDRLAELDSERAAIEASKGGLFSNKTKKLSDLDAKQLDERKSIRDGISSIDASVDEQYKDYVEKVNQYKAKTLEETRAEDSDKIEELSVSVDNKRDEIMHLKQSISDTDIGSFQFIARAFDAELDVVVKYFILILVIVFDPLAVTLVLAYNIALLKR